MWRMLDACVLRASGEKCGLPVGRSDDESVVDAHATLYVGRRSARNPTQLPLVRLDDAGIEEALSSPTAELESTPKKLDRTA
jgi:hypothetical protein